MASACMPRPGLVLGEPFRAVSGSVVTLVLAEHADLVGLRMYAVAGPLCDQSQHVHHTPVTVTVGRYVIAL